MARDMRPMLATPSSGASGRAPADYRLLCSTGIWVGDLKMDGIRAFAFWNGADLRLVNRNQVDITHQFPEIVEAAPKTFDLPVWLDGEIVCDSGRFEDTLTRSKQSNKRIIESQVQAMPAAFYAFDLPDYAPETWDMRRTNLEVMASQWPGDRFRITPVGREDFLDQTRAAGLEGVIAKNKMSHYEFGARSRSWIKFKNLHRVTCLVSGYEPGTGSRSHFGKMNLALLDTTGAVVACGSVGTGFTRKEIIDLKELLDTGTILVVEIECLNVTSGGTLRFPVYKGIRTDVQPQDCTIDQLDALPRC